MLLKVVDLELAGESVIAYRRDYLHFRSKDLEHDVKAYLVISRSGTSVRYGSSSDLLHMLEHLQSLEYSLGTYRKRVSRIFEDVSVDQILYTFIIICIYSIYCSMCRCAKCERTILYELLFFR